MSIWHSLLDLMAPRACIMCGSRLEVHEQFVCRSCQDELPRTHYERKPYDNKMAQLFWGLMPVERAAAWFYYAPGTRTSQVIYDLKYHHQPDIGLCMGRLMSRDIKESGFFDGIDAIVPVPLAKERLRQRGYNQSLLIARGISRETGIPVAEGAVRRLHFAESQTQLDRWERLKNVEQQFQVAAPTLWADRHILLVDDVATTGATIIACAHAFHPQEHRIRFSVLTLGFTQS